MHVYVCAHTHTVKQNMQHKKRNSYFYCNLMELHARNLYLFIQRDTEIYYTYGKNVIEHETHTGDILLYLVPPVM